MSPNREQVAHGSCGRLNDRNAALVSDLLLFVLRPFVTCVLCVIGSIMRCSLPPEPLPETSVQESFDCRCSDEP